MRKGFNRIALAGLLDDASVRGRYWLQLKSSNGGARAGLAFGVAPPPADRHPHGRGR